MRTLFAQLPLRLLAFLVAATGLPGLAVAADEADDAEDTLPTIAEAIGAAERREGLFPLIQDPDRGRIWLELPAPDEDGSVASVLYVEGLVTGLGSNPVGLDRGQLGRQRVIDIKRHGRRVLFIERNLGFRALSQDPLERRATRQSFAPSVEWASEVAALDRDGRSLIEISSFLIRDAHGVEATLRATEQGAYALEPAKSAVDFGASLAFPDNLEFEALLSYGPKEGQPGPLVERTASSPEGFSLVQHHSLIRLPDDGYKPRRADPRIGFFGVQFLDYAAPLDASIERWWISRHRLEKVDPSAERSRAVEPIVYYVDAGAPEPIRSALVEGAMWWAEAFEAAGFIDAFRVEVMPAHAHPLDVRYNVIQWVHRSTRGWSYGGGVIDPRSGEILKGHVSLGSLRVRQDRLLFEGLLGTEKTGTGDPDDPIELALRRIRQLSAHEVGHTLGLTHNFAASTYDGRASVMDYPAPLVRLGPDGGFDVSEVYGVGVGSWDVHTIRYGYSHFPPGADEAAALGLVVAEGLERGLTFIADADARPLGASDPRGNLWDNGADAVEALELAVQVRGRALERFGLHNLPAGEPVAKLEEVLVPVYFHHRYQLDAAVKTIGGVEYDYAIKGDGQQVPRWIDAERQRRALRVILGLLEPEFLDLPGDVIELMTPRPWGDERGREMFRSQTQPIFDALGAAESAADQVVAALLEPHRLGRLLDAERRLPGQLGLGEVLAALVEKVAAQESKDPRRRSLRLAVRRVVVERLMALAAGDKTPLRLRLPAEAALVSLRDRLEGPSPRLAQRISRFLERPFGAATPQSAAQQMPPGSPIGGFGGGSSWGQSSAHSGCGQAVR